MGTVLNAGMSLAIEFSLVICVYEKESPLHFSRCLDSIQGQTVMPSEIIIVEDGPLPAELEEVVNSRQFTADTRVLRLPQNVTQGPARAEGVKEAKFGWIAIMDSDDICRPDRFEKQLGMIADNPGLGLIGGQIAEFDEDSDLILHAGTASRGYHESPVNPANVSSIHAGTTPHDCGESPDNPASVSSMRTVPCDHAGIVKYAKKRNPFNQMTVMFRRDAALDAGNYGYFPGFEDYDLWARMIRDGVECANHPDVLVDARVGRGMYGRRRGAAYVRSEWRMQRQLMALGFINIFGFARNILLRVPPRLLPEKALATIYKGFARRRPARQ